MGEWPSLPNDRPFPAHMEGDGALFERMRETYARIAWSVAGDRELAQERIKALEWCRAHGNPHLQPKDAEHE